MTLRRKAPMPHGTKAAKPRKAVKRANPKRKASEFTRCFHSDARVKFVQSLPCWLCGATPSQNAHLGNEGAGTSRRANYDQIAPLCAKCHPDVDEARISMGDLERCEAYFDTERRWQAVTAHQKENAQ